MGNKVGTLSWDPSPRDLEIQKDLTYLRTQYSLSDAGPGHGHWQPNKVFFSAENAGIWRMVISDQNVTSFLDEARLLLKHKYKIEPRIYEEFLMM